MASTALTLVLISLTTFLVAQTLAQAPSPSPSGSLNLTAILEKGGQFTTLIKLLKDTQQLIQIESQLGTNSQGFTLFAPTDSAFQNLKPGALNDLTNDQKVKLVLFHVSPKFYTLSDLLTVSNPVRTQATEEEGTWGLNFTGQGGNQVNVSTGVVHTQINNALRDKFPLAIYQVDKVLLPLELFGTTKKRVSSAPSPKASKNTPETPNEGKADEASSPSGNDAKDTNAANVMGFGLVAGLAFICIGALS